MKGGVRNGYTVIVLTSSLTSGVPLFDVVDSSVPARPLGLPGPRRGCLPPRFDMLLLLLLAMPLAFPVCPPPRPLPPQELLLLPLDDDLPPPPFRRGVPVDIPVS